LSLLSKSILDRDLYKVNTAERNETMMEEMKQHLKQKFNCTEEEVPYLIFDLEVGVSIYDTEKEKIKILTKDNKIHDLEDVSELLNLHELSIPIKKKYLFEKIIH
jgi:uncharacterized protein